jgi:hypothetical protein
MLGDPNTGREGQPEGFVQAAAGTLPVDVLQHGLAAEVGPTQAALQRRRCAPGPRHGESVDTLLAGFPQPVVPRRPNRDPGRLQVGAGRLPAHPRRLLALPGRGSPTQFALTSPLLQSV